jgi:hypothetical protein
MKIFYIISILTLLAGCSHVQEHETTRYWERIDEYRKYVNGEISNVDFKTAGVQPFRMKIWYKPEAKAEIHKLIAGIEKFGKEKDLYNKRLRTLMCAGSAASRRWL